MSEELNSTLLVVVFILAGGLVFSYVEMSKQKWYDRGQDDCSNTTLTMILKYNALVDKYNDAVNRSSDLLRSYNNMVAYYDTDKMQLYTLTLEKEDFGPTGIYYGGQFYCVWAKDRDIESIATTETHEICHDFVFNEGEHFCGRYCNETYSIR